jgi:hypothetical protein
MNANRHRADERPKRPQGYPEQETGVPKPDPEEVHGMDLDLRSNAENEWQDEMPADAEQRDRQPKRSSHKGAKTTEDEEDADDDEPNGAFGNGDSARAGRA